MRAEVGALYGVTDAGAALGAPTNLGIWAAAAALLEPYV